MAAAPRRGGGGGGPGTPGRRTVQPVYEDFQPTVRWQEDSESHTLTIDLPGFMKDQIKVSTEGQNTIRVHGERLVGRNRRRRFQEDFEVPANGEMNRVRAKFEGGVLIITVAKKRVDKPQEAPPAKVTGMDIPKQQTAHKDQPLLEPALRGHKMKQDQPDVPRDGRRGTPFRDAGRLLPQDYEISGSNRKQSTDKTVEKDAKTSKYATDKTVEKDGETSKRSKELPEAGTAKTKVKMGDEAPGTPAAKVKGDKLKGKHKIHTDGADSATDKYKKAVQGLTELNEERQLLVNMGVAMLVIMALSAYVTYQFASGKDKN